MLQICHSQAPQTLAFSAIKAQLSSRLLSNTVRSTASHRHGWSWLWSKFRDQPRDLLEYLPLDGDAPILISFSFRLVSDQSSHGEVQWASLRFHNFALSRGLDYH